jgi:hypothetical protein
MFATDDSLKQHYSEVHNNKMKRETTGVLTKRQFVDDDVMPMIVVMPAPITRSNRAVYSGPSRSLSIGQNVTVNKKRRKS